MHIKSQQQERAQAEAFCKHRMNPKEPKGLHPIKGVVTPTTTRNGKKKKKKKQQQQQQHLCQTWSLRHDIVADTHMRQSKAENLGQVLGSCHSTTYYDPT